jgi:hypothetical protein
MHALRSVLHRRHRRQISHVRSGEAKIAERDSE